MPNRRRRQRRRRRRLRKTSLPKPSSLASGEYRTIIRVVWDVGSNLWKDGNSWYGDINVGYILPSGHTGLSKLFRSVRVHSMTAKFYQAVPEANKYGLIVMAFGDNDEIEGGTDLNATLAQPGNAVAKAGNMLRGKWYPTEPSDREFYNMSVSSNHVWARLTLVQWPPREMDWLDKDKTIAQHLTGKFIVDITATFRGAGSTMKSECACRKCVKLLSSQRSSVPERTVHINGTSFTLPAYNAVEVAGNASTVSDDFESLGLNAHGVPDTRE